MEGLAGVKRLLVDLFVWFVCLFLVVAALAYGPKWFSVPLALVAGLATGAWLVAPHSWRSWIDGE